MKLYEIASSNEAEIIKKIKADCQPFLEQWNRKPIYRGMKKSEDFMRLAVRQDRKPSDTPEEVQDALDKYFTKEFGFNARGSSMFAVGSMSTAMWYGTVYMVFPIGDFKFVWSGEIGDMYVALKDELDNADEEDLKTDAEGMSPVIKSFLRTAEYRDDNLPRAIDTFNEIMIGCKEYYAIKVANGTEVAEFIAKL